MTQLAIRENWFEDLVELRRGFDQLFNRLLTGWPRGYGAGALSLRFGAARRGLGG